MKQRSAVRDFLTAAPATMGVLFSPLSSAAETKDPERFNWTGEHRGEPLNLSGYAIAMTEEFDENRIVDDGADGTWFAPVHSDVGAGTWDKPSAKSGIYAVANGILSIRALKDDKGKWHSGSVQTVDSGGRGFAQQYGYFEARMKFPASPAAWCAFWLKSQPEHWDKSLTRPEIDVVEWYGVDPKGHHQTVHLWPAGGPFLTPDRLNKHWYKSNYTGIKGIESGWHTHGVLITLNYVVMYVDRVEVARFPTLEEFKLPLYPLLSLILFQKGLDKAQSPFELQVDYVRVYAPIAPNPPVLQDVR